MTLGATIHPRPSPVTFHTCMYSAYTDRAASAVCQPSGVGCSAQRQPPRLGQPAAGLNPRSQVPLAIPPCYQPPVQQQQQHWEQHARCAAADWRKPLPAYGCNRASLCLPTSPPDTQHQKQPAMLLYWLCWCGARGAATSQPSDVTGRVFFRQQRPRGRGQVLLGLAVARHQQCSNSSRVQQHPTMAWSSCTHCQQSAAPAAAAAADGREQCLTVFPAVPQELTGEWRVG